VGIFFRQIITWLKRVCSFSVKRGQQILQLLYERLVTLCVYKYLQMISVLHFVGVTYSLFHLLLSLHYFQWYLYSFRSSKYSLKVGGNKGKKYASNSFRRNQHTIQLIPTWRFLHTYRPALHKHRKQQVHLQYYPDKGTVRLYRCGDRE